MWTVFLAGLATALATGLGVLPFVFVRAVGRSWLGAANAISGGLMLAAGVALVQEGADGGPVSAAAGVLLGVLLVAVLRRQVAKRPHLHLAHLERAGSTRVVTTMGAMLALSTAEGVSVGVGNAGRGALGAAVTIAIALENVPQGLAISLVLVPRGASTGNAALWSIFSSVPQPLMAVPAFLFVDAFGRALPVGLGFAAGALASVALSEYAGDALDGISRARAAAWSALAFAAMAVIELTVIYVG